MYVREYFSLYRKTSALVLAIPSLTKVLFDVILRKIIISMGTLICKEISAKEVCIYGSSSWWQGRQSRKNTC